MSCHSTSRTRICPTASYTRIEFSNAHPDPVLATGQRPMLYSINAQSARRAIFQLIKTTGYKKELSKNQFVVILSP
jgi:hypothetical protein